ncbi:two-component response regulator-like APRR9 [Mycobacterium kubicae]|uniref:Two-component response regulator-like APRR9 n=1 Tax=Mycobacterium kubicae TaxID=120959 RepID=A0AAX1JJ79_9MYCO|nr:two-component response regulator-like APRR9 [Mycobacterium kubicae]ORV97136.1 hypothetical protein AWC13_17280 [Mycobacterium kubicae]QNI09268.1 two-component response regulator-like APRR9 [Mycobacterium kubicae]QNI14608.1 two-component response regulator-like APRR9 [Mycobacterium kubicae]QPI40529.1 two-component response regulator-like APRR9 [Mycobacterium kubicae]
MLDYFLKIRPRTSREIASRHLKQYTLSDDPNRYGIALPSEEKYMQVLALSYEQLNSALLDGMPESITSKVPLWIQ